MMGVLILSNGEEFREIQGYEGLYSITSFGRVYSHERLIRCCGYNQRIHNARFLKPKVSKKGYLNVELCRNGSSKSYQIHKLVAIHFISNPLNLPQVNHKDGNKQNNYKDNLEWCTNQDNMNHAMVHKLYSSKKYSKYFGVSFRIGLKYEKKPWRVYIVINKKQKHIGYFKTEIEAAQAYNKYVIEHGLNRLLNKIEEVKQ